jgi:DNA-binding CsgD family transcriptional regulator
MLCRLQEVVGFDAGYIAASWGNASEGRGAVAEHDARLLRQNLDRYLSQIHADEVALYTDRAQVHHQVWSRARQNELAVFRELLTPSGMKHMIVRVGMRAGNMAGFNLERRSAIPYTDRELALVDAVAPFLHIVEIMTLRTQDECISAEFAREQGLTQRESEFVALAVRGLQNSEIAVVSGVSVNTVRNTLARVFAKVGVTNRAELAYLAARPNAAPPTGSPDSQPNGVPLGNWQAFATSVLEASRHDHSPESATTSKLRPSIVYTPPQAISVR